MGSMRTLLPCLLLLSACQHYGAKPAECGSRAIAGSGPLCSAVFQSNLLGPSIVSDLKLAQIRRDFQSGNASKSVKALLRQADAVLKKQPVSVVNKIAIPPSGLKNDFMSLNPNLWPDSRAPGKWVYRDGAWNHDLDFHPQFPDRGNFNSLKRWVSTLSLAYRITGKEVYAIKAAELLRHWFVAPETRMNPNLEFAYATPGEPGKETGWASGVIELQSLHFLLDSVRLIETSTAWTADDREGMKAWSAEMLSWLQTSQWGKMERESIGNHGTYWDVFASQLALMSDQSDVAKAILQESLSKRIAAQILPDGRMPKELGRATSLHYSIYNIEALFYLGLIGRKVGVDVFNYQTPDGRSLLKALDFVVKPALGLAPWPFPQNAPYDPYSKFSWILRQGIQIYPGRGYDSLYRTLDPNKISEQDPRLELIF